ncbi:hypothetical protein HK405_005678 [Cladochytrium tenue]|nr:hypothetical protein HK405_005678 [Cladochytrium tenue]
MQHTAPSANANGLPRVVRPLAPVERYYVERHRLRVDGCVAWAARYRARLPSRATATAAAAGGESSSAAARADVLAAARAACRAVVAAHPRLRLAVRRPATAATDNADGSGEPAFVALRPDLPAPVVELHGGVQSGGSDRLAGLIASQMNQFTDQFGTEAYLWRVAVAFDSDDDDSGGGGESGTRGVSASIVLSAHHLLLDGVSGMRVLVDLLKAMQAVGPVEVPELVTADAVPRIDEQCPGVRAVRPLLLLKALLPAAVAGRGSWTPASEVASRDLRPEAATAAAGRTRPFDGNLARAEELRGVAEPGTLPAMQAVAVRVRGCKDALRARARRHAASLHTALLVAAQDALAEVYGLGPGALIASETPVSIRHLCRPPQPAGTVGLYLSSCVLPGHPSQLSGDDPAYASAFWADARRKRAQLASALPSSPGFIGLLAFVGERQWESLVLSPDRVVRRDKSFEVSNLLEWAVPPTLDVPVAGGGALKLELTDVLWGQPIQPSGALIALNVASVASEDDVRFSVTFREHAGIRHAEIERFADSFRARLARALADG